ncbi:hypothetical protein LTR16_001574 [Cryomyces antarcticus]|uniref:SWR1-complex protein 4 n=1 Tax=Cryomyces antarcticus TaxID=329879 RepID=A0ABR0LQD4_9PEZI|nr:hypothetical protein LTR60_001944 [Cryomyces antarcticus]KAK5201753.1 hypothetical protein LTR16_001574 [Cryomyces antarcticus]
MIPTEQSPRDDQVTLAPLLGPSLDAMPLVGEILAKDLCSLTAEDLKGRSYFKLKDPANLTAEQLEEFRNLVNAIDKSRPVDVDALNERLEQISSTSATHARSRSSSVVTPDPEDHKEDYLREEKEAHDALILDGGLPSHPIDTGFDILDEPGQYADIISFWRDGGSRGWDIIQEQVGVWKEFRAYQEIVRQSRADPEKFARHTQRVRDYRREKALQGDIELCQDRRQQSRLDDWKEYQFYQYRTADRFTRQMKYAEMRLKLSQERLQAAQEAGQSAQSIELIKEYGVAHWKGEMGSARIDLERHDILLRWIDEQLPKVASECGSSSLEIKTRDHSDLDEAKALLKACQTRSGMVSECGKQSSDIARNPRKRKRMTDQATLGSRQPSKLCKLDDKKKTHRVRKLDRAHNAVLPWEEPANDREQHQEAIYQKPVPSIPPRRSQRIADISRPETSYSAAAVLGPVHSSKVQKPSVTKEACAARSLIQGRLTEIAAVDSTQRADSASVLMEKKLSPRRSRRLLEKYHTRLKTR